MKVPDAIIIPARSRACLPVAAFAAGQLTAGPTRSRKRRSRCRAPLGLRNPIDIDAATGRTLHLRVGSKSCSKSCFMNLSIDPLTMSPVLLEVAAQRAELSDRSRRGLTEIARRGIAE